MNRPARLNRRALERALQDGLRAHRDGDVATAAAHYRTVLANEPHHLDALHLLGIAARDAGQPAEAFRHLEKVVHLRPRFAEAHGNLGLVLAELGRPEAAIAAFRRALALDPALVETWFNLANTLRDAGDADGALAAYAEALARRPFAAGWRNHALLLTSLGRHEDAVAAFRAALGLAPDDADLWDTLGVVLQALRRFEEAIPCHFRATRLREGFAQAHNHLGNALKEFGRMPEAIAAYRAALAADPALVPAWNNLGNACLRLGQLDHAMLAFRQALTLDPDFADAELNLGNVLKLQGHLGEAAFCFNRALALKPDFIQAHNNLGVVLAEQGQHADAAAHLARALELDPGFAEAHNNLGNLHKNAGRLEEAIACFRQALALRPDYAGAHSNLLFTLNFVDGVTPAALLAAHRDFNARHAAHLTRVAVPHANSPDPARRLRVGYVSPDLRAHACAFFVEPILRHHRRTEVEVHVFAEVAHPDAVTRRLQALADAWHSTVGLGDDEVAALIRAQEIDVLVDLAGHTANGRLLALARRPAPVQMAYLGYPATTGLDAMDYRITDSVTEPPGVADPFYTERLIRLPHTLWCYQPFADMPAVSPLPALARGYLTFGSFNSYTKIGPRVVTLWADLLRALPDSRLTMITVPAGADHAALQARFAHHGVDPARIDLRDRLLRAEYLALFAEVDVALDPFPVNGGTTTCDALWMGLPVVTLTGDTFLSRASYSLLNATGLTAFAAADPVAYVQRCREFAADLPRLAALRSELRPSLAASPLLDAESFVRDLEDVYRTGWRAWCAAREATP